MSDDFTIVRREGICGGAPVITGTRITVNLLWNHHYRLGWSVDRILEEYPHLSRYQVQVAIQYGKDHPEVITHEPGEEEGS